MALMDMGTDIGMMGPASGTGGTAQLGLTVVRQGYSIMVLVVMDST